MEAWRIHFENLATPSLEENKFDLERNSLCTIQNDLIAEATANKEKITPATEAEVGRCRHRMVVGFTITYTISKNHHSSCEFESRSWRGLLDTTLCD